MRKRLKNRVHDAAFDAQRCAIGCRRERAGDERHQRGNFICGGETLQERAGPGCTKEFLFYVAGRHVFRSRHVRDEFLNAFRACRAGQHRIYRDSSARRGLRQTSRESYLHRLRDAVVNHLGRDVRGRFTGNENDASSIRGFHLRQIMTRQADPTHKVRLDNRVPVVIGDLLERFRLVHAEIVD